MWRTLERIGSAQEGYYLAVGPHFRMNPGRNNEVREANGKAICPELDHRPFLLLTQ